MSDMTTDELRRTMKAIVETAPEASDVFEHRLGPARSRRRTGNVVVAAAAFVIVLLVGGLSMLLLAGSPNSDAAGGASPVVNENLIPDASGRVHFPGDFAVSVVGDPVESEGALVYVGGIGPEPNFDTSQLGIQVSLRQEPAASLVVPPKPNQIGYYLNALQSPLLVYLGDINGAQIALQWVRLDGQDDLCVFFGNGTAITGGGICKPFVSAHPVSGFAADPPIGGWVLWTKLDDGISVVRMELADGSSYWQRPRGRTAFFNLPNQTKLDGARLTTYDANGQTIVTEDAKSQIQIEIEEDMRQRP